MVRRRFFVLFLIVLSLPVSAATSSYPDTLVHRALELGLDHDPYWKILLHYRKRWWGGLKSEINSPNFFNAQSGKTDPQAELIATIRHFFDVPTTADQQPHQCRFIDRYHWLKAKLGFDPQRL